MPYRIIILFQIMCLMGCRGKNIPDVSNIKVDLQVQRFENDFFTIDTLHLDSSMLVLQEKYPYFTQDFIFNILALPSQPDSVFVIKKNVAAFIASYNGVKYSSDSILKYVTPIVSEVKEGLQFLKFYFPEYKAPSKLITFIGPINSYANILTTDALAVGLQLYLGKDYSLYQTTAFQEMYPSYISRRFSKDYIAVNCMKTIADDMFPDKTAGRPMIEQMVQAGKKMYLLDQLLPEMADTLKIGYTQKQLDGCIENERVIWSFFARNELLFSTDPSITRDYMNEAPNTQVFGNDSPGFIGQFIGWQIVKKWVSKNNNKTLAEIMNTNPATIFTESKYKP